MHASRRKPSDGRTILGAAPLARQCTMPPAAPATASEAPAPPEAVNGCGIAIGGIGSRGNGIAGGAVHAIDGSAPTHGPSGGAKAASGAAAGAAAEAGGGGRGARSESTRERRSRSLAKAAAANAAAAGADSAVVVERDDGPQAPRVDDEGEGKQCGIRGNIGQHAGSWSPENERRG